MRRAFEVRGEGGFAFLQNYKSTEQEGRGLFDISCIHSIVHSRAQEVQRQTIWPALSSYYIQNRGITGGEIAASPAKLLKRCLLPCRRFARLNFNLIATRGKRRQNSSAGILSLGFINLSWGAEPQLS